MPALVKRYRLLLAASAAAVAVLAVAVTMATGRHAPNLARVVAGTAATGPAAQTASSQSGPKAASPAPGAAATTRPGRQPPPHPTETDPPSGILNTQVGPFGPATFTVRNAWRGPVGSDWVFAYAGGARTTAPGGTPQSDAAAPTQPGLRVYESDGDEPFSNLVGVFSAPNADSPLTITGSSGTVLTLKTDSGRGYHFDLQTHRYV
jgi:hypothetical protein